jgi:hypothetical protein
MREMQQKHVQDGQAGTSAHRASKSPQTDEQQARAAQSMATGGRPSPAALAHLQRTVGNASVGRMLQRYGGRAQWGIPGAHRVEAGGMLWHGTNVAQFENRARGAAPGAVTDTPSPPAWFAGDPAFSAHVSAGLHPDPVTYMNAYILRTALNLLAFDDCADLNTFLGQPIGGANEAPEAELVRAAHPAADGYMLEADAVRGQPEYVLFARGLAKLRRVDQLQFQEQEEGPPDDPSRRHLFHGRTFGVLGPGMEYSH